MWKTKLAQTCESREIFPPARRLVSPRSVSCRIPPRVFPSSPAAADRPRRCVERSGAERSAGGADGTGGGNGTAAAEPCVAVGVLKARVVGAEEGRPGPGPASALQIQLHLNRNRSRFEAKDVRSAALCCAALRGMCAHNGRRRTGTVRDAALE